MRDCVLVGAASEVVAKMSDVKSVEVRMVAVLVLESSCRVVGMEVKLRTRSIVTSCEVKRRVLT